MSFGSMAAEIHGSVPKIPWDYCKTLVNRAWGDVRHQNLWSFLLFEANWLSPSVINAGTVTTTRGASTVQFDATAQAALNASGSLFQPIIQRQFRVGISTIYNIWAYDTGTGVATLDRPFYDPPGAGQAYMVFQCYYPVPYQDFWYLASARDEVNFISLFIQRYNREDLDNLDPQRTWYYFPTDAVLYKADSNPASPTFGFPMYELWGAPQTSLVYQLYGVRKGSPLVNPSDTLPLNGTVVGEDCVIALAKAYAYEWAEANKGDQPRNQQPDWKFLIGSAKADYNRLFRQYRRDDRNVVDNWFTTRKINLYGKFYEQYSSLTHTAFPGVPF